MSVEVKALLFCLFTSAATQGQGPLHLSMDRTPDTEFCARLKCVADVSEDKSSVQSIIGLRIYKTDLTNKWFKLASVSLFDSSPHLELARSLVLNITGKVTRFHGDLNLGFRDESDCLYGSFLCELNFINTTGHPLVVSEVTIPQRENLDSILLSKLAGRVETHSADVTKEHGHFSNQTASMEAKLDSLLRNLQKLEELKNLSYEIPQLARCYKGMSRAIPRLKILLWNNVEALCDTHTDGGGWIVFQRRTTGAVDFYRNWTDYKIGFGDTNTDYWLGNDAISNLTSLGYNELRVDLKKEQKRYFAHYLDFSIANESLNYQLIVSGYDGTAGDSLGPHNNMYFSTFDKDNDNDKHNRSCSIFFTGAWWYNACYHSHLNGVWGAQNRSGINWNPLIKETSADYTEMKIRQG